MEENLMLVPVIKLGTRVRIKPGTRFYGGRPTSANPSDVSGSIIEGDSSWMSVKWDNGCKNNYEESDLIFESPNDMVEVDVNKIYFKDKNIKISNINELFSELYPYKKNGYAVATYYHVNATDERIEQCKIDRMRSFDDMLFLANTYLPELSVKEVFKGLLLFNVTPENISKRSVPKSFSHCSTIRRIRYNNSFHNFDNVLYSINCNKYDSIYSWKDLFNMIDVTTGQDLELWYKEQFKEVVQ